MTAALRTVSPDISLQDLVIVPPQGKKGKVDPYQLLERVVHHRLLGTDHRAERVELDEWCLGGSVISALNLTFSLPEFPWSVFEGGGDGERETYRSLENLDDHPELSVLDSHHSERGVVTCSIKYSSCSRESRRERYSYKQKRKEEDFVDRQTVKNKPRGANP